MKPKIFSTSGWEFKCFAHLQYFIIGFGNIQELIFVPLPFGYPNSESGHNPTALIWQKICLERKKYLEKYLVPQHVLGCQPLQVVHKYSSELLAGASHSSSHLCKKPTSGPSGRGSAVTFWGEVCAWPLLQPIHFEKFTAEKSKTALCMLGFCTRALKFNYQIYFIFHSFFV